MNRFVWRCDLVPQYLEFQNAIKETLEETLLSGRYILGEKVHEFETRYKEYIGCKHAIGVNNGTDALFISLKCMDVGEGDEVITTPFTAIPTYSAIRQVGARPVFVDIDPETYLMNLGELSKVITKKTKAIVPVHLFGNVVDIEKLRDITRGEIKILEDCAQSHGATVRGKQTGSLGDMAAFSFYPTKNLGGYGDGGIITTNNSELAEKARLIRMYGMVNKDEIVIDGINSRLDEIQAAILLVKLRYLNKMNHRRKELAAAYQVKLKKEIVECQRKEEGVEPVYHIFSVRCKKRRDIIQEQLNANQIQTNVYYTTPLYKQLPYQKTFGKHQPLPIVESVCGDILALPMYSEMPDDTLEFVAEKINQIK